MAIDHIPTELEEQEDLYDEDQCIQYIRNKGGENPEIKSLSDDQLLYLVDLYYDFMNSRGIINEDDEEYEVDLEEIYQYALKNIARDEMNITLSPNAFADILDAENDYVEEIYKEVIE